MLGPAYAVPILRKGANHELRRYVKAEFNEDECHWFNCRSVQGGIKSISSRWGRSLFAKLRRPEPAIEASPTLVPCAVMLGSCREDDQGRPAVDKRQPLVPDDVLLWGFENAR